MSDKRIAYISLLQIVGPLFVVLGHSLNGLSGTGAWYVFSKEWIYIFHMPLFFFVSGYLLSFKNYLVERKYGEFVVGKVKRLLFPYIIWNLLFLIPKYFAQNFVSDEPSLSFVGAIKAFVFPRQNVWGHTWFLMALFIVYLAAPLFQKLFKSKNVWISTGTVIICIILYILPISTEFLALSDLHKDLLFFSIGCLLGQIERDKFVSKLKSFRIGLIIGAIVLSVVSLVWYEQTKPMHFITCTFIIMAFLSIFVLVESLPAFWEKLASCSFGIYILHWPIMVIVRILLHQVLSFNVPITAIAMSVLGYFVPIFIIVAIRALPLKKIKKPLKYLLGV